MRADTVSKSEALASAPARGARALRASVASALVTAAFVLGDMGVSNAAVTTTDPTGGAAEDFMGSLSGWVTSHGVPLIFGLLLIGVTIGVAIKYGRKGARAL